MTFLVSFKRVITSPNYRSHGSEVQFQVLREGVVFWMSSCQRRGLDHGSNVDDEVEIFDP